MKKRNFNEIYQDLLVNKSPELEILQKRKRYLVITSILGGLGFFIFLLKGYIFNEISDFILSIVLAVLFLISIIMCFFVSMKCSKLYKNSVIHRLVKAYSPNLNYEEYGGITEREYRMAEYYEDYTDFYSEDCIVGDIDDEFYVRMSDVKVQREEWTEDSEGREQRTLVTVFNGLFGYINIRTETLPYFDVVPNRFSRKNY